MNFLSSAVEWIRRKRDCEKLVKRTATDVNLSTELEFGGFKINIGNLSKVIKELVKVPEVAVSLDDAQYHICTQISLVKDSQLKEKFIAIRLQLIIAFSQLRAILASVKEEPTEELQRELAKWLRYMNDLHMHSIATLDPQSSLRDRTSTTLEAIRQYQGLDGRDVQNAVSQLM